VCWGTKTTRSSSASTGSRIVDPLRRSIRYALRASRRNDLGTEQRSPVRPRGVSSPLSEHDLGDPSGRTGALRRPRVRRCIPRTRGCIPATGGASVFVLAVHTPCTRPGGFGTSPFSRKGVGGSSTHRSMPPIEPGCSGLGECEEISRLEALPEPERPRFHVLLGRRRLPAATSLPCFVVIVDVATSSINDLAFYL
jgi:hypothetical protein